MIIKISKSIVFILLVISVSFSCSQQKTDKDQPKTILQDSTEIMDFPFKDLLDNTVYISDFRGKYVVIDMWYSGCGFCISCNKGLKKVHKSLIKENIIFLSISVDDNKEIWIQSITKDALKSKLNPWAGKYYPAPGTVTLNTGGSGYNNEFVKKYVPNNSYPKLLLIDPTGKIVTDDLPRPDNHPENLISYLQQVLKM